MLVNMIYNGELTLPASAKKTKDGYYCFEENGRAWRVKHYSAYCYVDNVEIETLQHNFGRYEISLTGHPTGSEYNISGEAHPHVHRGRACWGELYDLAYYFLGRNEVEEFAGIAERLLRSYDSRAPYAGWWRDIAQCSACDGRIEGRANRYPCGYCGATLCRACVVICRDDLTWCRECLPCTSRHCSYRGCGHHVEYIERNVVRVVSDTRTGTATLPDGETVQYSFTIDDDNPF